MIEYRAFYTKYHPTAQKIAGGIEIGATECCLIMYFFQFYYAAQEDTNTSAADIVDFTKILGLPFEAQYTKGTIVAAFTSVLSIQYNLSQLYHGFMAASDKPHALLSMLPFF